MRKVVIRRIGAATPPVAARHDPTEPA